MDWIKKPIYFILLTFILVPVFLYTQENSLYNLLLTGSIEDLKEACRERGISDKGDIVEVRRRLIDYERERSSINILPDVNALKDKNIVLKNADYLRMYRDENGDEILFLFGNVHLTYDNKYIRADIVRINTTKKIVIGRGNIKYTDTVRTYESDSFYYNEESDRGIFFRAKTKLGNFNCSPHNNPPIMAVITVIEPISQRRPIRPRTMSRMIRPISTILSSRF